MNTWTRVVTLISLYITGGIAFCYLLDKWDMKYNKGENTSKLGLFLGMVLAIIGVIWVLTLIAGVIIVMVKLFH